MLGWYLEGHSIFHKIGLTVFRCCLVFLCIFLAVERTFANTPDNNNHHSLPSINAKQFVSQLTADERRWLETHPIVTYTGHPNWLPFEGFDSSGNHLGVIADYLELVEGITGLHFQKTHPNSVFDALQLAVNHRVDVISGDSSDQILNKTYRPLAPYSKNNVSIIMHSSEPVVEDLYSITNSGIALVVGYGYSQQLKQEYPNIEFQEVDSVQEGLSAVSSGSVGALLVPRSIGAYAMAAGGYTNVKFVGATDVTMSATLFVSPEKLELASILNKAFQFIYPSQRVKIASHWSTPALNNYSYLEVSLTTEERNYLKKISPITLAGDPDWLPYEAFDKQGRYIGQVADHVDVIQELLGVKFTIVQTKTWSESVQLMRDGKVDVLSETDKSVLANEVIFTQAYTSSPMIVVMRQEENYVDNPNKIKHKKVALVKNYGNTVEIRERYSDIPFLDVNSVQDGLIAVSTGEIDALLVNSAQAIFYTKYLGLNNIKIVGKTDVETRLAFAINFNKQPLVGIINKALRVIINSPKQQKIFDKWNSVEYSERVDYALAYKVLAVMLVLTLLGLWWGKRLKNDIVRRKKITAELFIAKEQAKQANHSKTTFLAMVSHELRTPLNGILGMLELLERSPLKDDQRYMANLAKNSSENLLEILNDILDISKIEANKMDLLIVPTNVKELIETCVDAYLQNAYDKHLDVDVFISPELNTIFQVDPMRLRQIVNNLLSNAIKFTKKGKVSIGGYVVCRDNQQCELSIVIKDTGIGISSGNQKRLFQEFVQVHNESERQLGSSGLGLNISHKLSQLMGGKISLVSEQGEGTEVTYTQTIEYGSPLEGNKNKWAGFSVALLTKRAPVIHSLEQYMEYFGATVIAPIIAPINIEQLKDFLTQASVQVLMIDKSHPLFKAKNFRQLLRSFDVELVELVSESSFGVNQIHESARILNVNPLQPSFIELLLDSVLGISVGISVPPEHMVEDEQPKGVRLLVAEDHLVNRMLVSRQLEILGYQYTLVENGEQAISQLQKECYDGVLTDCHMPIVNGYELAQHIRKLEGVCYPIIAMTANALSGEKEKCFSSGMDDFLVKPVSIHTLKVCLDKWFPEQETQAFDVDPIYEGGVAMTIAYCNATEKDIDDLRRATASKNRELIQALAHRMLGAAKIVFADDMIGLNQALEDQAHTLSFSEISIITNEMEVFLVAYKKQLIVTH